jgi:hypothetical protein
MAMTVDMMIHQADQYIPALIVETKQVFPDLSKPILIARTNRTGNMRFC